MLIHPTFKFVSYSQLKSRHASPNHHRPTNMLHCLMDMLRSNASPIQTPWPSIWVEFIYLCFVTENHVFSTISGPIIIPLSKAQVCKNMYTTHNRLPLLRLWCTAFESLKAHLIVMSNNNSPLSSSQLFCRRRCIFKSTFSNKSDPMSLFSIYKKLWTPSSLSLNLALTSFLKCAIEDWIMPTKTATFASRNTASKLHQSLVLMFLRQRRHTVIDDFTNCTSRTMSPGLHNAHEV